jgi:hypothetical protein
MKYKVGYVPKEDYDIFKDPQKSFEKVKDKLKYNNGFYFLSDVPLLCRHEYLLYDNVSYYNVCLECSVNNTCKYCGDSLPSVDQVNITLPKSISKLIYKLMEEFGAGDENFVNSETITEGDKEDKEFDEDTTQERDKLDKVNVVNNNTVFLYLYNKFGSYISTYVKEDSNDYEKQAEAIAALIIFNVFKISGRNENSELLDDIYEICKKVNWTPKDIDKFASKYISDTNEILNVLTKGFEENHSQRNDMEEIKKDSKVKSFKMEDMDKIKSKMNEERYKRMYSDYQNIDQGKFEIKSLNNPVIEDNYMDYTESFNEFSKWYCMDKEHIYHEFENNEVCKYCKLKKDLSNIEEIFKKYDVEFSKDYDFVPICKFKNEETNKREETMKEIEKASKNKDYGIWLENYFNKNEKRTFEKYKKYILLNSLNCVYYINSIFHGKFGKYIEGVDNIINIFGYMMKDKKMEIMM